jgi:peptide deformylase
MEVWDDCMCFPDLLVKVMRHKSCRIRYRNQDWKQDSMVLHGDLSELLKHEYDHLDGILAVSRAIDGRSFALKSKNGYLNNNLIRGLLQDYQAQKEKKWRSRKYV